jgi:hypothetical protein
MLSGAVGCVPRSIRGRRHRRLILTRGMKGWVVIAGCTLKSWKNFRGLE